MCFLCWLWIIPPAPVLSATAAYNWHFAQLYHTRRTITPVCTSVRFTVQPTACVAEKRAERRCVGVAARVTLERRWGGLPREWAGEWEREKESRGWGARSGGTFWCGYHDADRGWFPPCRAILTSSLVFVWGKRRDSRGLCVSLLWLRGWMLSFFCS